jgi:hypothetical protein
LPLVAGVVLLLRGEVAGDELVGGGLEVVDSGFDGFASLAWLPFGRDVELGFLEWLIFFARWFFFFFARWFFVPEETKAKVTSKTVIVGLVVGIRWFGVGAVVKSKAEEFFGGWGDGGSIRTKVVASQVVGAGLVFLRSHGVHPFLDVVPKWFFRIGYEAMV